MSHSQLITPELSVVKVQLQLDAVKQITSHQHPFISIRHMVCLHRYGSQLVNTGWFLRYVFLMYIQLPPLLLRFLLQAN